MNENELKVLIDKMKVGDRESFNKLFRRYYTPLTRFCVRFVADGDQAQEIVQDLFVKLWTNREKLVFNTSFESYMLRSVRNAAITFINKERSHAEANERVLGDDSDANDPSETLQSNNLESSYRAILASMPEKRREVFLASRYDGMKYSEIAEKMDLSQKTVESHMSAAIKQLREGLKDYL
ncbi:MAG: RNA polymerase sigma-70 factor [bacterium]|jgi:RNA polymerase sigma-70 factor (ECF subfamily)|nr:MAG: RNA polymerase sigma-70 factor, ECF subfamily [bacterium F082]KWW31803.1 MAG: RNA polymerase sigma-70 factor, ECF subfamily [bacterium P201]MDO5316453.1 RNA polymerase sigma-70 factor [bacterium]